MVPSNQRIVSVLSTCHFPLSTHRAEGSVADLGVLLLHGYTSSLDTVNGLLPTIERLGLPYRMPVLRGHGTQPSDLRGVTWHDWVADGSAALDELLKEVPRAAVVGLS